MSDQASNQDEIKKFPPGFVYVPVSNPPATKREMRIVALVAWSVAILIHFAAAYAIGLYIDYRHAQFEITMAWSDVPLNGFGMMQEIEDWQDDSQFIEPPPPVEAEDDPFEEQDNSIHQPELDPNSIVIPEPEPEPEPEIVPESTPEKETEPDDDSPAYDLKRNKARLAEVRKDMTSMPNLHVLAPGNARVIVLIRNDRVLGSPFENSIRRLFKAFPDYRFTLGASDIDPVKDINAMLIATANPELYAETFLVVSHKLSNEKLKNQITAAFPTRINWETHNGHPLAVPDSTDGKYNPRSGIYKRSLYLPDDQTVLFLRPEVLPTLDVAHVDAIVQARDEDLKNPEKAQTFLQSLGSIGSSDSDTMPTLFLMVQGIEDFKLGSGFPAFEAPKAVMATLSTAARPHLNMDATFSNAEHARQFFQAWPKIVSAAGNLGIPGLGGLLNGLSLTAEKEKVFIAGDLNGTMIGLVLMFAANYLERDK